MKNILRRLSCVVTALVMAVMLLPASVSAATTPKLSSTDTTVSIGYYITLKVTGASGNITWSSGDSTVATVKSSGSNSAQVTGKKTGSTYIYAKTGSKTLKCKVTVRKSFITPSKSNVSLDVGKSEAVTLTVRGDKTIVVTNSDKSVATTSWGKWDGSKIKLTINAKKAGTTQLKVYTKGYSNSTAKTITVKVTDPNAAASASSSPSEMADEVIEIINSERAAVGVGALQKDDTLTAIAELRAKELLENLSHTRPDGTSCFTAFKDMGYSYTAAAENIAAGQKTAESVMVSWMNSEGHRANILNDSYGRVGVACVKSSSGKYTYYWVQVFSN